MYSASHSTPPVLTSVAIPASLHRAQSMDLFFSCHWDSVPPDRNCTYRCLRMSTSAYAQSANSPNPRRRVSPLAADVSSVFRFFFSIRVPSTYSQPFSLCHLLYACSFRRFDGSQFSSLAVFVEYRLDVGVSENK